MHIFSLPDNDKWPVVENPNFILIRFFPQKTVKQISVMVTTYFLRVGNKRNSQNENISTFLKKCTTLLSYIRTWHNFRFS